MLCPARGGASAKEIAEAKQADEAGLKDPQTDEQRTKPGHEAWLDPAEVDVMRDSGLAHILSISGLHMAVVGGFAFFLVRLLVAAWPWLALRVSGKKVAAWAGANRR